MDNNLSVSVIIPAYNRPDMLRECLLPVKEQTHVPDEVIVIDDGSQPPLEEAVKSIYPEAKYIYKENSGPAGARNLGIKESTATYIAFLDSDDIWKPKKLETQIDFFKSNPDAKICQTEEIWIRNGRRANPMKKHKKYSGWIFKECLPLCIVSPSAVMIKRELFYEVGLFDESLPACEDYDLWLRIASRYPIYLLGEPLIIKRGGHNDQRSRMTARMDQYRIKALDKIISSGSLGKDNKLAAIDELRKKCRIYGEGCIKHNRKDEGERYLSLAKTIST